jgi:hypothetical protein
MGSKTGTNGTLEGYDFDEMRTQQDLNLKYEELGIVP